MNTLEKSTIEPSPDETARAKPSLIVAMTRDGLIGRERDLPWKISADLQRFRKLTWGHSIIMGRTTWDSLGRALPGRTSIVLSRNANLPLPEGVLLASSIDHALRLAAQDSAPFVIGGGDVYRQAIPLVDTLHITWVEGSFEGDTYFPAWNRDEFRCTSEERHDAVDTTPAYTFSTYERVVR